MIGSDQLNLSRGKLHKAALWMSSVNYNVCLPSKYSVLIIQMPGRSVCYETEINKIKFLIKLNANTYYLVISPYIFNLWVQTNDQQAPSPTNTLRSNWLSSNVIFERVNDENTHNWDLLVLVPELAMLSIPRPECVRLGLNSSGNAPPHIDSPPLPVPVGSPPWI